MLFYAGKEFFTSALNGLKNRIADMNLLVVLGTSTAFFYSVLVMIFPDLFPKQMRYLYFDGAAALVSFILLGRYLEQRSKNKVTSFMKQLLSLKPVKARIKVDGKEIEIPAENVVVGDIFVVKPGEKIPTDGIITKGKTEIDQSMLTGEANPVFKKEGDRVLGGSINKTSLIEVKATKNGKESSFYQILKLIFEAQSKKTPIGKLADKVVSVFVPVVLIVAILVFDIWYLLSDNLQYGLLASISVLIIACPCALGLAIPIAIVATVGRGAKEKILIKDPNVLEHIPKIDIAIFDKTGTVTEGKPSVSERIIFDEDLLDFALPVLSSSTHPLAEAVKKYINKDVFADVENIKQIPGKGIKGYVEGKEVIIGNKAFLEEHGVIVNIKNSEKTSVYIAVDKKVVAVFYLEDKVKIEARDVIKKLKEKGIKTVLLSGDLKENAEKIGRDLGFDEIKGELLPVEKYKIIEEFQREGKKVLFIGDGINDAPAMKKADVGIAVWKASDLAKETGDVIFLKDDLNLLVKTINLSNESLKVIKQNLFWAILYNSLGIPIAGGILYPFFGILLNPVIAGIAMSFSSVSVVINALRLYKKNIS